jgi:hypothetical protein
MKKNKPIWYGVWQVVSLKKKRDFWTLIWMCFIFILAKMHVISDAGIAALCSPILLKIFTDHRLEMLQQQQTAQASVYVAPPISTPTIDATNPANSPARSAQPITNATV